MHSRTMKVIPLSDPPIVTGGKTVNSVYFEGDDGVLVDDSLVISDLDDEFLEKAEVVIKENFLPGDVLYCNVTNEVISSYVDSVLILSGITTLENYQAMLRTVKFKNTTNLPTDTDNQANNKRHRISIIYI